MLLNGIFVLVIPYPGQKVYKYIYSAIPKRPLIWQYTVDLLVYRNYYTGSTLSLLDLDVGAPLLSAIS